MSFNIHFSGKKIICHGADLIALTVTSTVLCVDDIGEAYNLIKDLEPTTPQEYILKGVVNAALGQEQGSVGARQSANPVIYFLMALKKCLRTLKL